MSGCSPRSTQIVQPVAQFLAAFPANLLFPIVVSVIVTWQLNPDIWLSPLMILGTQWYILFNVIAGASAIPAELRDASRQLSACTGWLWWRKVALPAFSPSMSRARSRPPAVRGTPPSSRKSPPGATRSCAAHGLGSYIADATTAGDFHRIVLGIAVMSFFVVAVNSLFWRPLYWYAERKYRLT